MPPSCDIQSHRWSVPLATNWGDCMHLMVPHPTHVDLLVRD